MTTPALLGAPRAPRDDNATTLSAEHARLLCDVTRRAAPVLALLDTHAWPHAELGVLIGQLRSTVLRQVSDEETHLFPHDASTPPFVELSADHARLHTLTAQLEHAHAHPCSRAQLRHVLDELLSTLRRHLHDEQEVLAALAAADSGVPSVAVLVAAHGLWPTKDDTPIHIDLDQLPAEQTFERCIERLLGLRPGQTATLAPVDAQLVAAASRWLRDFDTAQFGLDCVTNGQEHTLLVTHWRFSTPASIGYPG